MSSSSVRPLVVGPESPETPYPILLKGEVSKGFGRVARSLVSPLGKIMETGIYYGWASVGKSTEVWPMVMSFGWNPYYKNEKRSALRVIVAGYIRPEKNYDSLGEINYNIRINEDINIDIQAYDKLKSTDHLKPSA
ncbi:hypothetical protein BC829DRAFT_383136 [Chytridium lagenaria]|nr:hypothetical protein BC829DRAFT_383136 [Chytridium lagenaria]